MLMLPLVVFLVVSFSFARFYVLDAFRDFSTSGARSSTAHLLAKAAILCIPGRFHPNPTKSLIHRIMCLCSKWGGQGFGP